MALGAPGVEVTARLTRVALLHNSWLPDGRWDSNCTFAELPNGTLELSTYLSVVADHGMNIMNIMVNTTTRPIFLGTSQSNTFLGISGRCRCSDCPSLTRSEPQIL